MAQPGAAEPVNGRRLGSFKRGQAPRLRPNYAGKVHSWLGARPLLKPVLNSIRVSRGRAVKGCLAGESCFHVAATGFSAWICGARCPVEKGGQARRRNVFCATNMHRGSEPDSFFNRRAGARNAILTRQPGSSLWTAERDIVRDAERRKFLMGLSLRRVRGQRGHICGCGVTRQSRRLARSLLSC